MSPNSYRLYQIGKELQQLNALLEGIAPDDEVQPPGSELSRAKRAKNKLASRACRLKRKAQHEANKLKLCGLEQEHGEFGNSLNCCFCIVLIIKSRNLLLCKLWLSTINLKKIVVLSHNKCHYAPCTLIWLFGCAGQLLTVLDGVKEAARRYLQAGVLDESLTGAFGRLIKQHLSKQNE